MTRPVHWAALAVVLAGLAGGAGFWAFVNATRQRPAPPPHAGGIVVLTGGADRIETALRLLADDRAALLLVSGVEHRAGLAALTERIGMSPQAVASRVTLGRDATNTYSNAEETASWVKARGLHSLIVVTAAYHMPRALLELRRALPGVALYPVGVQPQGVQQPGYARLLVAEYLKLLGAALGVTQILPSPVIHKAVSDPVDKSGGG